MPSLRYNFGEWLPDLDDFQNPGLIVADNVFHQDDGYQIIKQQTTGAFATLTSVGVAGRNVGGIQVKPVGVGGTNLAAWLTLATGGPTATLEVGDPEVGALGAVQSATLASVGALSINAFQVCELGDKVFVTAEAQGRAAENTQIALNLTGYIGFTVEEPPISVPTDLEPLAGLIQLVGHAPLALTALVAEPGKADITITGYAPEQAALSLSISPSSINEFNVTCPITSSGATATPSNGVSPYEYLWTWESGGSGITINSPTAATTTFTNNGGGVASGVAKCTVTDDNDDQANATISVTLECGT